MWSISKATSVPFDKNIKELQDLPYTISYVIRKRLQIDAFNELPKEKRPPEAFFWERTSRNLDNWTEKIINSDGKPRKEKEYRMPISEIE